MTGLRGAIAAVIHQWFVEEDDACAGHPPSGYGLLAQCEQLANRIVHDLDWPDVDR